MAKVFIEVLFFYPLAKLISMLENEAEKVTKEEIASNLNTNNRITNEFNGRRAKEFRRRREARSVR